MNQQKSAEGIVVLRFPRFRRHLTWRDNAPGGENDDEEKTTVYGRVQV